MSQPYRPLCLQRLLSVLMLASTCLASGAARAQPAAASNSLEAFAASLTDVIARVEPSVVAVLRTPAPPQTKTADGKPQPFPPPDALADLREQDADNRDSQVAGAGVAIGDNLVLTQYLVVEPGQKHLVVNNQGQRLSAEIVGADPRSALAVLRTENGGLQPLEMGQAEQLRKGSVVVVVSNPYAIAADGQATSSHGTITNIGKKAPAGENLNNVGKMESDGSNAFRTSLHHLGALIQTDARLGWNASGGALVTLDGKLVGLTTNLASIAGHEDPAGYAIPMNAAMRRIIDALKQGKEVEYGLLGIRFDPLQQRPLNDGRMGVPIRQVYRGAAAQRAGLRAGDIVAQVGGQPTPDTDQLQLVVGALPPGEETHIEYQRGAALRTATLRLDKIFVQGEKVITNRPPAWQGIQVDYATAVDPTQLAMVVQQPNLDLQGCVAVVEVEEGSLSWERGVRPGMYISHVSGKRVSTPREFRQAIKDADGSVKLRFTAGNTPQDAKPVE